MTEQTTPDPSLQELVYPFYLDVEMLTGFLATLENGFSLTSDVSMSEQTSDSSGRSGTAEVGPSGVIGSLFRLNFSGSLERAAASEDRREDKFVLQHTETSLFNRLRSLLIHNGMVTVVDGETTAVPPLGAIVEIDGVINENPLSKVLSIMELVIKLSPPPVPSNANAGKRANQGGRTSRTGTVAPTTNDLTPQQILDLLKGEQSAHHLSDVLITVNGPGLESGILTLRRSATTDESMEHFVGSRCLVLGKVSGIITSDDSVPLYRRSILGLMRPSNVEEMFSGFTSNEDFRPDIRNLTVSGPAIQVLPLAIYV